MPERQEETQQREENKRDDDRRDNEEDKEDKDGQTTSRSQKSRGGQSAKGDEKGRTKQKEFFKEELSRLKTGLQKEADKIQPQERKEFYPYVHNTLEPYYDLYSANYLIELPEEVRHGYVSRQTAVDLCDPWVDHQMDVTMTPRPESRPVPEEDDQDQKKKQDKRPPKEGSTRLPKYPTVDMNGVEDLFQKEITWDQVPAVREQLKKKYSSSGEEKTEQEYQRTKKDFYRMELDKMDEYHPISRPHMRQTYFAYLQNNPGSRKAVKECVKDLDEKEKEEEEKKNKKEEKAKRAETGRSQRQGDRGKSSQSQRQSKGQSQQQTKGQSRKESAHSQKGKTQSQQKGGQQSQSSSKQQQQQRKAVKA